MKQFIKTQQDSLELIKDIIKHSEMKGWDQLPMWQSYFHTNAIKIKNYPDIQLSNGNVLPIAGIISYFLNYRNSNNILINHGLSIKNSDAFALSYAKEFSTRETEDVLLNVNKTFIEMRNDAYQNIVCLIKDNNIDYDIVKSTPLNFLFSNSSSLLDLTDDICFGKDFETQQKTFEILKPLMIKENLCFNKDFNIIFEHNDPNIVLFHDNTFHFNDTVDMNVNCGFYESVIQKCFKNENLNGLFSLMNIMYILNKHLGTENLYDMHLLKDIFIHSTTVNSNTEEYKSLKKEMKILNLESKKAMSLRYESKKDFEYFDDHPPTKLITWPAIDVHNLDKIMNVFANACADRKIMDTTLPPAIKKKNRKVVF